MSSWRVHAVIFGCLAILAGCTHDFDAFESANDEGGSSANGDAGDACAIATVCTTNAKSCADNCNQAETKCEGQCGGGGGGGGGGRGGQCKADCADAGVVCIGSCVSACTLCTNCSAEETCKAAAN